MNHTQIDSPIPFAYVNKMFLDQRALYLLLTEGKLILFLKFTRLCHTFSRITYIITHGYYLLHHWRI